MKKKNTSWWSPKTTGYSNGHYFIGQYDLEETSLYSLEILCSKMEGQMTDADIMREHKKTGDYDANEMNFNIWVNGFLIQFQFELMGIHVMYNAWELKRPGNVHMATPSVVTGVVDAVTDWLKDHYIEDICEAFYEAAEQGIAWQIVEQFKFKNREIVK